MLQYISNSAHYKEVLSRVQSVKETLWIGTADIKDVYIEVGKEKKPFLALIAQLIRRGVDVRLIHTISYSEKEFSKNSSLITRSAVSYCSIGAYSVDSPYTTRHHTHHPIRCILLRA